MKDITLHINNNTTATCIPNSFIDELMPDANGEYVKIYLYLLRCINSAEDFSISKLADKLDHTEKDIKRALAYWAAASRVFTQFAREKALLSIGL